VFRHLFVPLDGSHLAEAALPAAVRLGLQLDAEVTLFHVIERNAPKNIHGEHHITDEGEAEVYLQNIAGKFFSSEGITVHCHVHSEEVTQVARSIVQHALEFAPDLIILCAHGEGGWRELMVGSIAQQVIGMGKTPVLLVQPGREEPGAPVDFGRMLLAVDNNPEHGSCVDLMRDLALRLNSELHLLTVVPTWETLPGRRGAIGRLLPGATRAALDLDEEEARQELAKCAADLRASQIVVESRVLRGDPAPRIVQAAQQLKAGVIVLGTHGKVGMDAYWSGSVAPRVATLTRIPLLLIPVGH
jgi:nucleotide-binding universal stress UspA family protein